MKQTILFLSFLILAFLHSGIAQAKSKSAKMTLSHEIHLLGLDKYEKAGKSVSAYLRKNFVRLAVPGSAATLADQMEEAYSLKVQPGLLENVSVEPRIDRVNSFIQDVHNVLDLRSRHQNEFRRDAGIRKRIQNIFIGALHVLDVGIRSELDSSVEELLRVKRYLLSQGTFISKGGAKLTSEDLWWDWMWLRGHGSPSDLVEMHQQKVILISKNVGPQWQSRLREHALAVGLQALRQNSAPVLGREKPAVISLRLVQRTLSLVVPETPAENTKELKLYLYKYLQANGQTYEASQIKKEIAMDLFFAKGWQIVKSPAEPWARTDLSWTQKVFASTGQLIRSVFTFVTYGAGFLFVATPIEFLLVLLAIMILCKQGASHFGVHKQSVRVIWKDYALWQQGGWRRIPQFVIACLQLLKSELSLAWKMFVASYTSATVPFYSKVAASLLLFGVGLYFNSARSLVEAVVNQMTM